MKIQTVKSLFAPLVMVMIGFGLMAGCSNKQNNNDAMMADSSQTSMNEGGMNDEGAMNEGGMHEGKMMSMHTTLSGQNEVPSNNSDANGTVTVKVHNDSIHVTGQFSELSTDYKASHIHMGAKGENGEVIQPLDPDINNDQKSGSFDGSFKLNNSQMQAMKNGKLYVNVHSQKYPKGEIRGQLTSNSKMNDDMDHSMNDNDDSMSH